MYFYNLLRDMVEERGFGCTTEMVNIGYKNIERYQKCNTNLIQLIYLVLAHQIAIKTKCTGLRKETLRLCKNWLDNNILPNGCLYECMVYDSLDFQVESLLILSIMIRDERQLLTYTTKYKGSVLKSIRLLIPYVLKQKMHICYFHSSLPSLAHVWDTKDAKTLIRIYLGIFGQKKIFSH